MASLKVPKEWNSEIQAEFSLKINDVKTYAGEMFGYLDLLEDFAGLWETKWIQLYEDCKASKNLKFYRECEKFYDDRITILNIMDGLIDF